MIYFLQLHPSRGVGSGLFYINGVRAIKPHGPTTTQFMGTRGYGFDPQDGKEFILKAGNLVRVVCLSNMEVM